MHDEDRWNLARCVVAQRGVHETNAATAVPRATAHDVFGSPDDMKLRSSATLFAHVSPPESPFHRLLERFFDGRPDEATSLLLAGGRP